MSNSRDKSHTEWQKPARPSQCHSIIIAIARGLTIKLDEKARALVTPGTQPSDEPSARRRPSRIRGPRRPMTLLGPSIGRFMNSRVRSGAIFVKAATYFAAFELSAIVV